MTNAVIVLTARTPIGKASRGALDASAGRTLLGHTFFEAAARATVDPRAALAVQVIDCRDRLDVDLEKINVNGGAIPIGPALRHVGRRPRRARPRDLN